MVETDLNEGKIFDAVCPEDREAEEEETGLGNNGHSHNNGRRDQAQKEPSGRPLWRDTLHVRTSYAYIKENAFYFLITFIALLQSKSFEEREGPLRDDLQREMVKYQEHFDEHARMVYPSLFVVFNVGYWSYYGIMSRLIRDD